MDKKISYLNRNYSDYKDALIAMSEKYYPDLSKSYDDASVASWQIDLVADVADNLSYHIDRVYQETNIDSANERASLYSIARNNGVKIPGPKGAMAEVKFSVRVSSDDEDDIERCAPIIKRGTILSSGSQQFELTHDIDFASQFDVNGNSDRTIVPIKQGAFNSGYVVSKLGLVVAGETRVYKINVKQGDIQPFMEILLPVTNVMGIESIIEVDCEGDTLTSPPRRDFYCDTKNDKIRRFYEVDNLAQGYAWADTEGKVYTYRPNSESKPIYCIAKGEWKPIDRKFITEYTDNGYLKIIFGAGVDGGNTEIGNDLASFSKWQMSKILNNNNLGVLPNPNTTLFILYRVGGGKSSNVAQDSIRRINNLISDTTRPQSLEVVKTVEVTNTTSSVSGKDMPTNKELKYYIKYHKNAQERCVTVKDYLERILLLPPKYGTPFRVGVMEENNKIMIYLLGIDENGKLSSKIPLTLIKNIENYLSAYRSINDYVEIKSGRIVNLKIDAYILTDKNYNSNDVELDVINKIQSYMDINNHLMGEEFYVGDLEREIAKIDGVLGIINLLIYNVYGDKYSNSKITQEIVEEKSSDGKDLLDLEATDGIIYNEGDCMLEVKYPTDIAVHAKER